MGAKEKDGGDVRFYMRVHVSTFWEFIHATPNTANVNQDRL